MDSLLGPILFVLNENDCLSCVIQYADDTSLICSRPNIDQLERDSFDGINSVYQYLQENGLVLNESETNFIEFQNNHHKADNTLNVNHYSLEEVQDSRFLGVNIDINI